MSAMRSATPGSVQAHPASVGASPRPAAGSPTLPSPDCIVPPAAKRRWVAPMLTIEGLEEAANGSGGVGADDALFAS
mgnify:CR=1 FL=1